MLHGHSKQQLVSLPVRHIWADDLHEGFGALESAVQNRRLEPIDWIAGYLFVFWSLLRMISIRPPALPLKKIKKLNDRKDALRIGDLKKFLTRPAYLLVGRFEDFENLAVRDLFINECLPGFSQHISIFFQALDKNIWPVQVLGTVPLPVEILKWQQVGQRCISLLSKKEELATTIIDGKDPFKFALHDIEHSYHFFKNENIQKGQIGFYKKIDSLVQRLAEEKFWREENFKKDFNYLISDMNSHCVHLTKTLHAILMKARGDENFNDYWKDLFTDWELEPEILSSFHKVNLKEFTDHEAKTIEKYFLRAFYFS